jgi:hypothetical protein
VCLLRSISSSRALLRTIMMYRLLHIYATNIAHSSLSRCLHATRALATALTYSLLCEEEHIHYSSPYWLSLKQITDLLRGLPAQLVQDNKCFTARLFACAISCGLASHSLSHPSNLPHTQPQSVLACTSMHAPPPHCNFCARMLLSPPMALMFGY